MSRPGFDLMLAAVLAAMIVIVSPTRAQTQGGLSEKLARSITGVKRAEVPSATGASAEAARVYEEALGEGGNPTPDRRRMALKSRAWVYEQAREFDRAEADYTAATKIEPIEAIDLADRGYFYMRSNRYGEAIADFVAGGQLDPQASRFRFAIGRVHAALRDYRAAIDYYTQAIRLNARDSAAYLSRAEAYLHLKRYDESTSDYDRALGIGMRRPGERIFAYLGRGYVRLIKEDFDKAAADFDAALDIDPYGLNAWLWRAHANERRGRIDLALDDYERAYMLDPVNPAAAGGVRRLRSKEPLPAIVPEFQIDEKQRLAADTQPGLLPRRRSGL